MSRASDLAALCQRRDLLNFRYLNRRDDPQYQVERNRLEREIDRMRQGAIEPMPSTPPSEELIDFENQILSQPVTPPLDAVTREAQRARNFARAAQLGAAYGMGPARLEEIMQRQGQAWADALEGARMPFLSSEERQRLFDAEASPHAARTYVGDHETLRLIAWARSEFRNRINADVTVRLAYGALVVDIGRDPGGVSRIALGPVGHEELERLLVRERDHIEANRPPTGPHSGPNGRDTTAQNMAYAGATTGRMSMGIQWVPAQERDHRDDADAMRFAAAMMSVEYLPTRNADEEQEVLARTVSYGDKDEARVAIAKILSDFPELRDEFSERKTVTVSDATRRVIR